MLYFAQALLPAAPRRCRRSHSAWLRPTARSQPVAAFFAAAVPPSTAPVTRARHTSHAATSTLLVLLCWRCWAAAGSAAATAAADVDWCCWLVLLPHPSQHSGCGCAGPAGGGAPGVGGCCGCARASIMRCHQLHDCDGSPCGDGSSCVPSSCPTAMEARPTCVSHVPRPSPNDVPM